MLLDIGEILTGSKPTSFYFRFVGQLCIAYSVKIATMQESSSRIEYYYAGSSKIWTCGSLKQQIG